MARLGAHIRFFIHKKMAEDTAWQKPAVIFSGQGWQWVACCMVEGAIAYSPVSMLCFTHAVLP